MTSINRRVPIIVFAFFLVFIVGALCACNSRKTSEASVPPEEIPDEPPPPKKRTVIMAHKNIGEEAIGKAAAALNADFGLIEGFAAGYEDASIQLLIYPDDFLLYGRIEQLSSLLKIIDDPLLSALVCVSPPEFTGKYLAQIRSLVPDLKIVTVLPDAEILSAEAWSDAVLSFGIQYSLGGDSSGTESEAVTESEIAELIYSAVMITDALAAQGNAADVFALSANVIQTFPRVFAETSNGASHRWELTHYRDPDTGLRSVNHFTVMRYGAP